VLPASVAPVVPPGGGEWFSNVHGVVVLVGLVVAVLKFGFGGIRAFQPPHSQPPDGNGMNALGNQGQGFFFGSLVHGQGDGGIG